MKFTNAGTDVFVPDGAGVAAAFARVTHLGIGAHQDDLEFMAFPGIAECHRSPDRYFGGVVCTDGAGSSRSGRYAEYSDARMREVRREEQREAAIIGGYAVMVQLDYPSGVVKDPKDRGMEEDLLAIFQAARPSVVYCHQPADKHETHIAVFRATLNALRRMPREERPEKILGCEVWRGLDWMLDAEKVVLDVSGHGELAAKLNAVFDSQIAGGKQYDAAVRGRRCANATFHVAHAGDTASEVCLAMDLTPLILDDSRDVREFACGFVDRFRASVAEAITRQFAQ